MRERDFVREIECVRERSVCVCARERAREVGRVMEKDDLKNANNLISRRRHSFISY